MLTKIVFVLAVTSLAALALDYLIADDETRLERGAAVLDDLYAQLSGARA